MIKHFILTDPFLYWRPNSVLLAFPTDPPKQPMKKTSFILLALFVVGTFSLTLPEQSYATPIDDFDPVGTWQGTLEVPGGGSLRIVFHVTKDEEGKLSSTMDSPDQGAFGLPMDLTAFQDNTLRMEMDQIDGVFEGTANEAGALEGSWTQGGQSFPLVLERVEEEEGE